VAGAEDRVSLATGNQVGGNANRGARLSTRGGGWFRHLDNLWSLDDVDRELTPIGVALECRRDCGGHSDEEYLEVEMTGGSKGTVHDGGRRVIATHRVNGDSDHFVIGD